MVRVYFGPIIYRVTLSKLSFNFPFSTMGTVLTSHSPEEDQCVLTSS